MSWMLCILTLHMGASTLFAGPNELFQQFNIFFHSAKIAQLVAHWPRDQDFGEILGLNPREFK